MTDQENTTEESDVEQGTKLPLDPEAFRTKLTDTGNAARLASLHGQDLRYCGALGWEVWTGKRWRRDDTGVVVRRAIATVRSIYREAEQEPDQKERWKIAQWAKESESKHRLEAMIRIAQVFLPVSQDELDADPWLLNCDNGTLDLRTGDLRPHRRGDFITKLVPAPYDPEATAPRFELFLDEVFLGSTDLIGYAQRLVGYTLVGENIEHIFLILYGGGANGKSTLVELLHWLLGDYARTTPTDTFLNRRAGSIPSDIARLAGVRLVSAMETDLGRNLAEGVVKAMTGGDTIIARELYKPWFEFKPAFTAWLSTNHLPEIRGTDHGTWRRIKVIPFLATFDADQQDKTLGEKLRTEAAGVLAWAVRGTQGWLARGGLDEPPEVLAAVNEYRTDLDVVGLWIEERCEVGDGCWATSRDLHASYTDWAAGFGAEALSDKQLGGRLAEKGFRGERRTVDGRQQRVRVGLQVKELSRSRSEDPGSRPEKTTKTTQTPDSGSPPGAAHEGEDPKPASPVGSVVLTRRRSWWPWSRSERP